MRKLHSKSWPLLFALALVACDDGGDASPMALAPVVQADSSWVQLHFSQPTARYSARGWETEAWFAEFSGVDVGTVRDVMEVLETPPAGCTQLPGALSAYTTQTDERSTLRFRAVGGAAVEDDRGTATLLQPRALSLYAENVSGVVYRGQLGAEDSSRFTVSLQPSTDAPASELSVETPSGLGLVQLQGKSIYSSTIEISSEDPLTLQVDGAADESFVVLRAANDINAPGLACTLDGDTLTLTPAQLDATGVSQGRIDLQLTLRNEHELVREGATAGALTLDLHDRVTVIRARKPAPIER